MFLEETIEMMIELNELEPIKRQRKQKVGLDIELKVPHLYAEKGINVVNKLFEILKKYEIETYEKASKTLPIII